jgi:hypothetical protein
LSVGTKVVKVGISVVDCKVTYVNDLRVTVLHLSLVTGNPVVCNMTAPVVVNMPAPVVVNMATPLMI